MQWIDSHCHLDAAEFSADALAVRSRAAARGVAHCVLPAVAVANFEAVRKLAHRTGDSYALGIHPLFTPQAQDGDLARLDAELLRQRDDPRLVAIGEIGLDYFVPELMQAPALERQRHFYLEQLKLARKYELPVLLHSRHAVDAVLKGLRDVATKGRRWHGIAHAFSGSASQAQALLALGLKLGFGGALTYPRALRLQRLATSLPIDAMVLETDSPDMLPQWLYRSAAQRQQGMAQGRNEPGELPTIAAKLAALRAITSGELAQTTTQNCLQALPKLALLQSLPKPDTGPSLHTGPRQYS